MEKEDRNVTGGDKGDDEGDVKQAQPMRPVPPPEAFRHTESFPSGNGNRNGNGKENSKNNSDNEHPNRPDNILSSEAAAMNASASAPPRKLRRRSSSSLFGQLPVRRKSRLFDDTVPTEYNQNNGSDKIVAETIMATNFSASQSTWLQDDHQSTLLGGDSRFPDRSQFQTNNPPEPAEKASLFGAVMRQFGSNISSSPQKKHGGFRNLMASPSGKTIMNIVNQFNSPFKFQSPSSGHKKRQRRRRLWSDEPEESPKRQKLNEEDETSKQGSNNLFPETNNDSRSSLGGGLVDEQWREAPIVEDTNGVARMEVFDWSIVTKVKIEAHGGGSSSWIMDAMRDHQEELTYWIHQSPIIMDNEPQALGVLGSSSNLSSLQKSIHTISSKPFMMSRQGSVGSRLDAKLIGKSSKGKRDETTNLSSSNHQLAKDLIQSVRGPHAKYSRNRVLEENSWWEVGVEDPLEKSRKHWQQALRSLFCKYRRRVLDSNNKDSLNAIVLDTYFYCVGQDHSVLFRLETGSDPDSDDFKPVVLVSSTSESFRNKLESNGIDIDQGFQLLESIQERESRERKRIIAATVAASKSKRIFQNVTQDVQADLEALRRAQAFGEQAGADVMVRVKKKGDDDDKDDTEKEKLPKAIQISGWDNASLFLEVYLNLFGDTMVDETDTSRNSKPKLLPLLICPNTKDFGAFEHASLKRLSLFPAEGLPSNNLEEKKKEPRTNDMEIHGIILPCALRKILLVARNRILQDEKTLSVSSSRNPQKDDSDTSRYVVLHSSRPTILNSHKELPKSWIGGMNGSLIFNQGKTRKDEKNGSQENQMFECSYGNVVSMAVWDTSREEVAACKLDSAFPENWIHRK